MATIERFEDIDAWKDARRLVKVVYQVSDDGQFGHDFGLRDQMRRAAISTVSNIAEGFERDSNKEFVRFLYIAKASAGEVRAQLYLAQDLGYLDQQTGDELMSLAQTVSRRIAAFIKYLKSVPAKNTST